MGKRASSMQVPRTNQLASYNIFNRLADANPELGAEILLRRKRFQNINQITIPASIRKDTIHLTHSTCEFRYDSSADCTITILQAVKENSAKKLK